jgi:putative transcriptional regulator
MDTLTNQFLIAMPSLVDPNFHRTVTLICQHNEHGALGIVINRVTDVTMQEIFEQMDIPAPAGRYLQQPVFNGGPVQTERGFILHEAAHRWDATLTVGPDLALTTSQDILVAMSRDAGPDRCLVALGYAGWGAGQLEREMQANAWLSGPADTDIIFGAAVSERWAQAAQMIGVDIHRISSEAGHA